jgi:hypothetical protein
LNHRIKGSEQIIRAKAEKLDLFLVGTIVTHTNWPYHYEMYNFSDNREVRNENHVFPEKGTNPEKGSNVENPGNGFNPF